VCGAGNSQQATSQWFAAAGSSNAAKADCRPCPGGRRGSDRARTFRYQPARACFLLNPSPHGNPNVVVHLEEFRREVHVQQNHRRRAPGMLVPGGHARSTDATFDGTASEAARVRRRPTQRILAANAFRKMHQLTGGAVQGPGPIQETRRDSMKSRRVRGELLHAREKRPQPLPAQREPADDQGKNGGRSCTFQGVSAGARQACL
jgi:hypothetical protein